MTATTLSSALVFDNVLNGLARPFFGWISDVIGRENTMAIVFSFGALAYWGLSEFGHTPYMFIIMAGLIFFTWGEIFSLFPATCTDTFGAKYATTNAGLLYTAKGAAAWIVPLASLLKNYTGHWHLVFVIATTMNLVVAAACAIRTQADAEKACLLDEPQIVCRACERRSARQHAVGSDRGEVQSLFPNGE